MLELINTLSGIKEVFKPLHDDKVSMYVCGITPYDVAHIGHGRVYVTFDTLYRLLAFLGYTTHYCRNFTDIDDKLLAKAEKEFGDRLRYKEIADRYIKMFDEDMKVLGCLTPTFEPRVTKTIPEIIAFIQGLVDNGKAYAIDGDVYFSIASFPSYGKLSHQRLEDLRAGARVEVNDKKRDPLDFALWKSEKSGTFWESPWGWGRPGWHIECSAMAAHYLGKQIDIHAGGLDLTFPHHENEIAQSEGLFNKQFAKYWLHNGLVRVNQEKMSKSLGNFFTLRQVFERYNPMVIRYYILTHHYRAPFEFSFEDIDAVQKSYKRLCRIFEPVEIDQQPMMLKEMRSETVQNMLTYLADDLNTPGMWGVLFDRLSDLQQHEQELKLVKQFIVGILGLDLVPLPEKRVEITPEIEQLIQEREVARSAKDWATADKIRDKLQALGVELKDKKV
ncbi:MAG TPA: cysteine--tRNA ligase [Candidatus Babeliales bacterium]|nr:cysteine--tRNA ligase [Candidatus Babeliales bacterium]